MVAVGDIPPPTRVSARFAACLPVTLRWEGGFVNHPDDPGEATNLGISLRYARTRGSMFDLDDDGDVDADDIRLITVGTAGPAYRMDFWDKVRGDDLWAGLDLAVFDFAVNSGPARSIKVMQRALGVVDDGVIGPKTLAAVRGVNDRSGLVRTVCAGRHAFLRGLRTWPKFGRGWKNRVDDIQSKALSMALG